MQPRVLAIAGALTGSVHALVDGGLSIGRDEANALRLDELGVSRRHCGIEQAGDGYQVTDLESRNGTFVNGVPVKNRAIEHGDTIRVGRSEFLFLTRAGGPDSAWKETTPGSGVRFDNTPTPPTVGTMRLDAGAAQPGIGVEVGRMARDLGALFKISSAINSIRDAAALQQELLRLVMEVIPADEGSVLLLSDLDDEDSSTICSHSREDRKGKPMEIQCELVHRAIWERAAAFTVATPIAEGRSTSQNALCVPLVAVERTIGVIYLAAHIPAPPFREDHIHFLDSVSRIAAVTLESILAMDALRSENRRLKQELNPAGRLVGESRQLAKVAEFIARVAASESNVLIRGESGTGKEVVARSLHDQSPRRDRPFVAINCAAIPETLLESELFGHEKGAFTGAVALRKGKLEAAGDGTLFLDEIGELAPAMQAKLLRVLQQREFERVGGTQVVLLKARVLAATNKNLEEAIKSGEFRQDLYFRLNVVSVTVPPLREHRDDVPLLALYFAAKYAERSKRPFKGISREAREILMAYSWPGNVRELENAIEHAIVLGLTEEILPEDLPGNIVAAQAAVRGGSRYHDTIEEKRKELIVGALQQAKNNVPEAARLLGIHPKYLHRLVRTLGLKSEIR